MSLGKASLYCIFLFAVLYSIINCSKPLTQISSISPGIGYISDLSVISKKKCFRPSYIVHSDLIEVNHIDSPLRFSEMIKELKLEDYLDSFHFALETDYFSTYLNCIKDNDYSSSINYFSLLSKYIKLRYNKGDNILTPEGLEEYLKTSMPDFRLICGNQFIHSFEVGIGLFFAIKIHFINHSDKIKFFQKTFDKYEALSKILEQIEYTARIFNTKGYLMIYGIQMNSKDNFLNSKVKGFELCKSSSLFHISDECKDWVKFIANYLHSDFTVNIKQFVEESRLKELEPLMRFTLGDYISDYVGLEKNTTHLTLAITQKRAEFSSMVNKYKYIFDRLTHIQLLDAYKPAELATYKGNIKKLIDSLNSNDEVINCIYDIKNSEQCLQRIMGSALSIENQIGDFLTRFNELQHFKINLSGSYCLPPLFAWEYSRTIYFNFFFNKQNRPIAYLSTNEIDNVSCQRIYHNSSYYFFNCTESIIPLEFYLEKDDEDSLKKRRLICKNAYLDAEEETNVTMVISNHSLAFNLSDINNLV